MHSVLVRSTMKCAGGRSVRISLPSTALCMGEELKSSWKWNALGLDIWFGDVSFSQSNSNVIDVGRSQTEFRTESRFH